MKTRFKLLRQTLKLTQPEIATQLCKKVRIIAYYESGERNIDDGVLLRLHEVFNVNIDWMRTGVGEMFIEKEKPDERMSREHMFAFAAIRDMDEAEVQDLLKYIEEKNKNNKLRSQPAELKKENAG